MLNPQAGLHIAPTRNVAQSLGLGEAGFASLPLSYHNGPVMHAPTRTIPIFWEPPTLQDMSADNIDGSYNTLINRFFADFGGTGLYNNLTQYYQGSSPHVYVVNSSDTPRFILDTDPYPTAGAACSANSLTNCVTNNQMETEIQDVINSNSLTANGSTFYPLFTGKGEDTCYDGAHCFAPGLATPPWVYCGYHTWFPLNGSYSKPVIWAMLPYIDVSVASLSGCDSSSPPTPNGDLAFDSETPVTSHEFNEAIAA